MKMHQGVDVEIQSHNTFFNKAEYGLLNDVISVTLPFLMLLMTIQCVLLLKFFGKNKMIMSMGMFVFSLSFNLQKCAYFRNCYEIIYEIHYN
jgi:hypothetical protein